MTTDSSSFTAYIAATRELVWDSLRRSGQTSRFWNRRFVTDWRVDSTWKLVDNDRRVIAVGAIVKNQRPSRLELSWRDVRNANSELTRVTFELTSLGPDTKLCVVHDHPCDEDWPLMLSNLKSLLETGRTLSRQMWVHEDRVQTLLRERGYGDHVVDGGLRRLVEKWEGAATAVAQGTPQNLDDYVNEMNRREILHEIEAALGNGVFAGYAARVAAADKLFARGVEPTKRSVCSRIPSQRQHSLWWYFRRPRNIFQGNEALWPSRSS